MKKIALVLVIIANINILSACYPLSHNEIHRQARSATDGIKTYSAAEFFKTISISGSSISHDSSAVLVTNDSSGVYNIYRYPLDGSEPSQLTHSSDNAIYGVSWFPADNRILFTADQGGNELNHLYVRELDGNVKDLTPGDNLKARFLGWKDDNTVFFVATNERNPTSFDVYAFTTDDYRRTLIYKNTDALNIVISPNGKWLALSKPNSNADSDIYLVDLTKNDTTPQLITRHDGAIRFSIYTFTANSDKLIFGTNRNSEYQQAWAHDLSTAEKTPVLKADWDISFFYYSRNGDYRVAGINANAQTQLDIINTKTGEPVELPELPTGDISDVSFSSDGKMLAFYLNADNSPSNLYVYRLGDEHVKPLSDTLNPALDKAHLISSDVVHFDSFDGLKIPGLLYKPLQASAANRVPALIMIHGGPGGQSRKGYNAMLQHLLNHGYAIFAVNNRGSSGYGKTFFHLDDRRHGEDDLQDIVYGKKYLQSLEWVDPDKIGVIGRSYGGYLTMAAMAFTEEFDVGINIFGVTNWERTLNSIPPWLEGFRKPLYDEMGDPATDAERHRRISPLFHASNVSKPVLIVQGANDPRVLQVESDEMVAEIRKNGVFVDYVLFADEGPGLRKKANRITASEAYVKFLDTHLKGNSNSRQVGIQDPALRQAYQLLAKYPLIDTHNDLPYIIRTEGKPPRDVIAYDLNKTMPHETDLARMREGYVGTQFWSVYIPGTAQAKKKGFAKMQLEQIDIARRMIERYPSQLSFATGSAEIEQAHRDGRIASLLGIEGGHAIENSLGALRMYYRLGVRYMTLTHNHNIDWADAAGNDIHHGLTNFGKEVIREMNRLGMLVDLSHVSVNTMHDTLDTTEAPVIFSHSNANAITPHIRNVPDDILKRLPDNGGVVMVSFISNFNVKNFSIWKEGFNKAHPGVTPEAPNFYQQIQKYAATVPMPRASIIDVADHIEHIKHVAGIDHVGIGADFYGNRKSMIDELKDTATYPYLFAELIRRGWSDRELIKLSQANLLRVLKEAERTAGRLQKERNPSYATIEQLDNNEDEHEDER